MVSRSGPFFPPYLKYVPGYSQTSDKPSFSFTTPAKGRLHTYLGLKSSKKKDTETPVPLYPVTVGMSCQGRADPS